mgnify:CR=1 FL=1
MSNYHLIEIKFELRTKFLSHAEDKNIVLLPIVRLSNLD